MKKRFDELSDEELKDLIFRTAKKAAEPGSFWAQESLVLKAVADEFPEEEVGEKLKPQQRILRLWHELFREERLAWG